MDLETLVLTRNTWPIEVNRHATSQTDIDKLRQTFQKEGREFVEELYREFLNREPDLEGLEVHTSLLTSGSTKNSIMEAILWSVEGQDLLSSSVTLDLQVKNLSISGSRFNSSLYNSVMNSS